MVAKTQLSGSSTKKCCICGTKNTPLWRTGPLGKGTACNACGIKWTRSHREEASLFKPAPTKREKKSSHPERALRSSKSSAPASPERDPLSLYSSGLESDEMELSEPEMIKVLDEPVPKFWGTAFSTMKLDFDAIQDEDERLVNELFYLSRVSVSH